MITCIHDALSLGLIIHGHVVMIVGLKSLEDQIGQLQWLR